MLTADGRLRHLLAPFADRYLSRPFTGRAKHRVQIYWTRSRIAFSQIYPFLHPGGGLRHRSRGVEIRCTPLDALLAGACPVVQADTVLVQPWFTVNRAALVRLLDRIRDTNPGAHVVLLDPCAHSDLRLAADVTPYIDLYVKKGLLRDRGQYLVPTRGDSNLTDYFAPRFGIAAPEVDWHVPREILSKLRAGPGFVTAPELWQGFLRTPPDPASARPIDLHARLAVRGADWYAAMRQDAAERARLLPGRILTGAGIPRRAFLRELRRAKMVFSPFGYGELCWRDVEGFLTGAVVVKQDMSHLETRPDLFRPWETYVPVSWDLSDLAANVAQVRHDRTLRTRIAASAWQAARDYLVSGLQVDLEDILTGHRGAEARGPAPTQAAA